MMQTAEIETTRPVIRIVDDDEVFLASQKFFFETFFPEVRVWPCAKRYLDEEDLSAPGCNNFIGLLQISIFPGIPADCHSISEIFFYALTDFP